MAKTNTQIQVSTQGNLEEKRGFYWVLARPEIALLITLSGVLVSLANVWIIGKLAPITENIAVITEQVSALEDFNSTVVPRSELEKEFVSIGERLNRMEDKLDRLIERQ